MALPVDSFKRQLDSTLEASIKASNVQPIVFPLQFSTLFVYLFTYSPAMFSNALLFKLEFIANRCPPPTTNCVPPYIDHFKMKLNNRCFIDKQKKESEFFQEIIMMTIIQTRTGLKAISGDAPVKMKFQI